MPDDADDVRVVANEIGPPTSIGESALFDGVGLVAEFCDIRLKPGDGEPALFEPECDNDRFIWLDDNGRS